jgi:hypothetical protein
MGRALIELLPELKLESHKFKQCTILFYLLFFLFFSKLIFLSSAPWSDRENRREFFEKYAQSCGFDPLVPENWYSVPKQTILALKVLIIIIVIISYTIIIFL